MALIRKPANNTITALDSRMALIRKTRETGKKYDLTALAPHMALIRKPANNTITALDSRMALIRKPRETGK